MKAGKVWGVTEALLQNPVVEFHRIEINKGGECSTHKHAHKWNGFFVEEGELEIHVFKNDYDLTDKTILGPGEFMSVKPGGRRRKHRGLRTGPRTIDGRKQSYRKKTTIKTQKKNKER